MVLDPPPLTLVTEEKVPTLCKSQGVAGAALPCRHPFPELADEVNLISFPHGVHTNWHAMRSRGGLDNGRQYVIIPDARVTERVRTTARGRS
jgi:hypothetical protein